MCGDFFIFSKWFLSCVLMGCFSVTFWRDWFLLRRRFKKGLFFATDILNMTEDTG